MILEREQNFRQYQKEVGADSGAADPRDDQGDQQDRSSGGIGQDAGYDQEAFMG